MRASAQQMGGNEKKKKKKEGKEEEPRNHLLDVDGGGKVTHAHTDAATIFARNRGRSAAAAGVFVCVVVVVGNAKRHCGRHAVRSESARQRVGIQ